ncbi:hypothetical protein [Brachybacterium nesterenkovii]
MVNGTESLTITAPTPEGLDVLEHLGWEVKAGDDPRKPKRQTARKSKES